jgi:hypothetical protein
MASGQVATTWTSQGLSDALAVLTGIEAFEELTKDGRRTAADAAETLFMMASAFFTEATA